MQRYESFGDCLRRCLKEEKMSASEAAQIVGFKSRNSIFRILEGEASCDVKLRFLKAFGEKIGDRWPAEKWHGLEEALRVERLGPVRYHVNLAFQRVLYEPDTDKEDYCVHLICETGEEQEFLLADLLDEVSGAARVEIIVTGCCESGICSMLAKHCGDAGRRGTLSIRHYIDTSQEKVSQNILGILPLVTKPWYNARLVEPGSCPDEMMAVYRVNAIHIHRWDEQGQQYGQRLIRYDENNFAAREPDRGVCAPVAVLDKWRFHLELLKPVPRVEQGLDVVVDYLEQYAQLEDNCAILSIRPDVHFCCIPEELLGQTVIGGWQQSGKTVETDLLELLKTLSKIHRRRVDNLRNKNRITHLVYSLPMMERFMRTGIQGDRFFIQRPYTVAERRLIIRDLLETMRNKPYFNVHFLREGVPELNYEITCFDGRGVILLDADNRMILKGNDADILAGLPVFKESSEALITLPAFMESFKHFFLDELLMHYVLPRTETIRHLERLLVMNVQE